MRSNATTWAISRTSSATSCSKWYSTRAWREEAGAFAFDDVARAICDKMLRRHPHVFGDQKVSGSAQQSKRWEEIKREERGAAEPGAGVLDDVPAGLPALTRAAKLGKRAAHRRLRLA